MPRVVYRPGIPPRPPFGISTHSEARSAADAGCYDSEDPPEQLPHPGTLATRSLRTRANGDSASTTALPRLMKRTQVGQARTTPLPFRPRQRAQSASLATTWREETHSRQPSNHVIRKTCRPLPSAYSAPTVCLTCMSPKPKPKQTITDNRSASQEKNSLFPRETRDATRTAVIPPQEATSIEY